MDPQFVSASRVMPHPPEVIFDFLCDPANHAKLDGSDHVLGPTGSRRLTKKGDTFGMRMRWGLPYAVKNTVVEFEPNQRIAWRHFAGHRWRYELAAVDAGTEVTETFDPQRAPGKFLYPLFFGYPEQYETMLERSLEKLEAALAQETSSR